MFSLNLSNFDPLDLLQLSSTIKDLRTVLLQHSSTFVWKRARQNVEELPPSPDDLTEPKFAHLLFDNHCASYLRHTTHVQWESRTKYCRKCLQSSDLFPACEPDPFTNYVPIVELPSSTGRLDCYYYEPAIKALHEESESLCDETRDSWVSKKRAAYSILQSNARLCDD
ncbi:hypothetical protein DFS33DRAFT_1485350 [Desarmillaria ectypa]|nr:hypothetical protein DFS33DRAFT_1485350 [Desarmillaria ectypa]